MTRPTNVRVATHSSDLALVRVRWVAARLERLGYTTEVVFVGAERGAGAGLVREQSADAHVRAVQAAVRDGRADLAVHAFDELPSAPADGLELAAVPERAAVHDVVLVRPEAHDGSAGVLPLVTAARVGTDTVLRRAQLRALRPDTESILVRGPLPARVEAARSGAGRDDQQIDAVLLSAASLDALLLDLGALVRVDLDPTAFLPAPAQGALALEIRRGDPLGDPLTDLHDVTGFPSVAAERGLLTLLAVDLQPALGAHATRTTAGEVTLAAWCAGARVDVRHGSAEGAALLAFEALGRPDGRP